MRKIQLIVPLLLAFAFPMAAQLRQVAIIDIPGRPGFESMAFADGMLVIAHSAANKVDVFDPAKRRVVAQITGLNDPHGVVVDEKGDRVYVGNSGDQDIAIIDPKTWTLAGKIALSHAPDNLLLVRDTGTLYATDAYGNRISAVALDRENAITTIALDGRPEEMVFDPQSKLLLTSIEDGNEVVGIDAAGRVARRFKLDASLPTGLALDTAGRKLYVAVRYAVVVLNADTGAELGRVPVGAGVDSLWFDNTSQTLYSAGAGGLVNVIAKDNGRYVSKIELQTNVRGHSLAFDPARNLIFFPGGREGRSKLVILKPVPPPTPPTAVPARAAERPQENASVAEKK